MILEAGSDQEKMQWMLIIHFAKSRLANMPSEPLEKEVEVLERGDMVLRFTDMATRRSNQAIDSIFQQMEAGGRF